MMTPPPLLSICIVTGNRTALLEACLESLAAQVDPPSFELLVAADRDSGVADVVRRRFPAAGLAAVTGARPGESRNVLIEQARGEVLLFLDDDVTFAPDLLRRFADQLSARPEATVFGGPNITPPKSTRFQYVQGAVLSSFVATGPIRRRYGPHPAGEADERWFILCNLAVRRAAMRPFARELVCAEENAVLDELSRSGAVMHYDPSLAVYHERRPTYGGFVRQMHKYGRGRGQLVRREPRSVRLPYLVPSGFVLYLLALPLLATRRRAFLGPLALYAASMATGSAWIARTLRRPATAPLAFALITTMHGAYGVGVLDGLSHRGRRRETSRERTVEWLQLPSAPVSVRSSAAQTFAR
jgi:glycosyltransferase involved in cell wall biosynthesis